MKFAALQLARKGFRTLNIDKGSILLLFPVSFPVSFPSGFPTVPAHFPWCIRPRRRLRLHLLLVRQPPLDVRKTDELFIKNEKFCIKNEELCIKNQDSCIKNDEFCRYTALTSTKFADEGYHFWSVLCSFYAFSMRCFF